ERKLMETDANRARYHKQYYRKDWNDAVNYDLVVNTERLGIDGAVAAIMAVVAGEGGKGR
ncbi:MAG: cytidylate kinase-like family protein, partial [Gemmatimonadota bacterium]|nr:cytidylate kinase-like family protein [Gemmatimonadota bacterium]